MEKRKVVCLAKRMVGSGRRRGLVGKRRLHRRRQRRQELARGMERTRDRTGLQFNIALNYSGRAEIVDAVRRLFGDGLVASLLQQAAYSLRVHSVFGAT